MLQLRKQGAAGQLVSRIVCGFVLATVLSPPFTAQNSVKSEKSSGASISADEDCIVAIDDKVIGRVEKGHSAFFPIPTGVHTIAAATAAGDYWEQSIHVSSTTPLSLPISFENVRRDRSSLEQHVAELRNEVKRKESDLNRIKETTDHNTAVEASRRNSVVEAVNYYSDRWGKELGIRDSRYESSKELDDAISQQSIENLGNTDTASQATSLAVMGTELWMRRQLRAKAHKNQMALAAASLRMKYLGEALEDPINHPPFSPELGYLANIHDVKRNKSRGKLLTMPERIEYSDESGVERISCSTLRSVRGSKRLQLTYYEGAEPSKRNRMILLIESIDKGDRNLLTGDIYLACPNLTQ